MSDRQYLLRDVSWLSFNRRVLDEAERETLPLEERASFYGICSSNLDEFMQVRYPAVLDTYQNSPETIAHITEEIEKHIKLLTEKTNRFLQKTKLVRSYAELSKDDREWADKYFRKNIFPTLQAVTVRKKKTMNPMPGMYILVVTRAHGERNVGYIELPRNLSRMIQVKSKPYCVPIESIIYSKLSMIFHDCEITDYGTFRILRSAEVYLQHTDDSDPFELVARTLRERQKAWITWVDMDLGTKKRLENHLRSILPVKSETILVNNPLVRMADLKKLPGKIFSENQQRRTLEPIPTFPSDDLFSFIRKEDRLLFHPYESYEDSLVRFLEAAANDDKTISIKIALYRVSDNSRIIDALLVAADKGKLVTVLVELKARFDEHHNIEISNILREGGVRIQFTKPDIKTHAKVCLVSRQEKNGIRVYSHVGTGNYSEVNSKIYTDYSYFSADEELGYDLTRFFNLLTSEQGTFKSRRIIYAPYNMRDELIDQIEGQIKLAKKKKRARIIAKCNSLTDDKIADRLVEAAKAGVKVILIVRGACILEPGKNLQIYSIVGLYLEHSRLYSFGYGKQQVIYLGSADLMYRSFNRRFELLMKVEQPELKARLAKHLQMYLRDNTNRRIIQANYQYTMVPKKKKKDASYSCQMKFYQEAKGLTE